VRDGVGRIPTAIFLTFWRREDGRLRLLEYVL